MEEQPVKVYIYDLSKGLARSLSRSFLGKQLDGIWHTGIVVYGQEFFFGGMGIEECQPGGTILGRPDFIHDLGMTQIPFEMFMDYLYDLSTSTFRNECYHLFNHNCNNFSNEVAQFLTGKPIPSHITNLPQEVLETPFGAMIKPFIDAMSVNPEGGHQLFSNSSEAQSKPSAPAMEQTPSQSNQEKVTSQETSNDKASSSTSKTLSPVIHKVSKAAIEDSMKSSKLDAREKEILVEVNEYLNTPDCTWSLGRVHLNCICKRLMSEANHTLVSNLLINLVNIEDFVQLLKMDTNKELLKLASNIESLTDTQQEQYCKVLCNLFSCSSGKEYLTDAKEWKCGDSLVTNKILFTKVCVHCVLRDDASVRAAGSSMAFNISLFEKEPDTAIEIGGALVQQLADNSLEDLGEETAYWSLVALNNFMLLAKEVRSLASVMGLDLNKFTCKNEDLTKVCQEIKNKIDLL